MFNTINFVKPYVKKYSIEEDCIFIKKKIKIIPVKNIKDYNLTINGFQYVKSNKLIKDKLKFITNQIKKSNYNEEKISKIFKKTYFKEFKKEIKSFLFDFCKKKNNLGVKNINKHFTNIFIGEIVYRNSIYLDKKNKLKTENDRGECNPPINIIHTDKYKNESFTDWLHERKWWVDEFIYNKILPYNYLKNYKHYNKWSNFYEGKYVTILNVWISLSESTLNYPLIFCDKYSYKENNLIPLKYNIDTNINTSWGCLKYNKNQKFYYYPKMKKYDMVIFESIETPHTGIKLKDSYKYKPRESIEFRFIILNLYNKDKDIGYTIK